MISFVLVLEKGPWANRVENTFFFFYCCSYRKRAFQNYELLQHFFQRNINHFQVFSSRLFYSLRDALSFTKEQPVPEEEKTDIIRLPPDVDDLTDEEEF